MAIFFLNLLSILSLIQGIAFLNLIEWNFTEIHNSFNRYLILLIRYSLKLLKPLKGNFEKEHKTCFENYK